MVLFTNPDLFRVIDTYTACALIDKKNDNIMIVHILKLKTTSF